MLLIQQQTIKNIWIKYNVIASNFIVTKSEKSVAPLLGNIEWDQGSGWNASCPLAPGGPGGHAYAGCVATSTAQIMKYWSHPEQGTSIHSYYEYPIGTTTVTYYDKTYNWAGMPNTSPTTETADLLYDIGFAVDMQYSAEGSGSYNTKAIYALKTNFWYKGAANQILKEDYTEADWEDILKNELENDRPMLYRGNNSDGTEGHSFVCDGYSGTNYFHFNWGWSGSGNSYYYLDNLYYDSFSYGQGAGIGIEPVDFAYYAAYNLVAELNDNDVNLTWEFTSSGSPVFVVFRDDVAISDFLTTSTFEYNDNNVPIGNYSYTVKAYYDADEIYSEVSNEEEVEITSLAVNKIANKFKIYPNPTKNVLNIEFSNYENYTINITDITGKNIYCILGNNKLNSIDISGLSKGLYFVKIKTEDETFTEKIIVE